MQTFQKEHFAKYANAYNPYLLQVLKASTASSGRLATADEKPSLVACYCVCAHSTQKLPEIALEAAAKRSK